MIEACARLGGYHRVVAKLMSHPADHADAYASNRRPEQIHRVWHRRRAASQAR
jgi:hypothetical protein